MIRIWILTKIRVTRKFSATLRLPDQRDTRNGSVESAAGHTRTVPITCLYFMCCMDSFVDIL